MSPDRGGRQYLGRNITTNEGRLADRAYAGIVEIINRDQLQVGDRLPSEARLAEIFGMSRTNQ